MRLKCTKSLTMRARENLFNSLIVDWSTSVLWCQFCSTFLARDGCFQHEQICSQLFIVILLRRSSHHAGQCLRLVERTFVVYVRGRVDVRGPLRHVLVRRSDDGIASRWLFERFLSDSHAHTSDDRLGDRHSRYSLRRHRDGDVVHRRGDYLLHGTRADTRRWYLRTPRQGGTTRKERFRRIHLITLRREPCRSGDVGNFVHPVIKVTQLLVPFIIKVDRRALRCGGQPNIGV